MNKEMKKEMKTMIVQQLQEVQIQWQTNFEQLRQDAPEVLSAPVQSSPPQMPVPSFSPYYSYQGFGSKTPGVGAGIAGHRRHTDIIVSD